MLFGYIKHKSESISVKMTLVFSLLSSLFLFLALFLTYLFISYSFETANKSDVENKYQMISAVYNNKGLSGVRDFFENEKNRINNSKIIVCILENNQKVIFFKPSSDEESISEGELLAKASGLESSKGWVPYTILNDEDRIDLYRDLLDQNHSLLVGKSSDENDSTLNKILSVFAAIYSVFIFLSLVAGSYYSNKFLQPIRKLNKTIEEIENGGLKHRVEVSTANDELSFLGQAFNRMVAKIEKLIRIMNDSLDNVAHDIRTPLTKIIITCEGALASKNIEVMQDALSEALLSSNQISDLASQLMIISEAEAGVVKLNFESCNMEKLVKQVADVYEFVAEEKNINISIDKSLNENEINWLVDRKKVQQAIANLIDNAIKYSPNDSSIKVNIFVKDEKFNIEVVDNGFGVSDEELPKIWERLYRADKSRTQHGLGLGLAIVKANISAHGGEVSAKKKENGMIFSVKIPKLSG